MSSQLVTGFNVTDVPVQIDADGHMLGGGEYGTVNRLTDVIKAAVARGVLVIADDPDDLGEVHKQAAEAFKATAAAIDKADAPTRSRKPAAKATDDETKGA